MPMTEIRRLKNPKGLFPAMFVLSALLILSFHQVSTALVSGHPGCTWPADWPKALDEISNSCRTIEIAAGNQEDVFEIVFDNREKFENLWSVLLTVKTPGAPFRLSTVGSPTISIFSNAKPTLRIFAPAYSAVIIPSQVSNESPDVERLLKDGKAFRPIPPWPKELISATGELPEYVQFVQEGGRRTWVASDRDHKQRGFLHRARVDFELVVDGSVIDLNRIQLPSDGPIIDRRFDPIPCPGGQPCVMPPHDPR